MSSVLTRLQKRYVVEGDALALQAMECIESLRLALAALLANPSGKAEQREAKRLIRQFTK